MNSDSPMEIYDVLCTDSRTQYAICELGGKNHAVFLGSGFPLFTISKMLLNTSMEKHISKKFYYCSYGSQNMYLTSEYVIDWYKNSIEVNKLR